MASPPSKTHRKPHEPSRRASRQAQASTDSPEAVDPVWLVKAFGVVALAALVCGYLTLCLLFYQGQWQLVLHPSRTSTVPATIAGAPIQVIHFGVDESAMPQLTGWWIPGEPSARYAAYTLLYLPGGDGSLADSQASLAAFHALGINIFAFDYRGYGQSASVHPSQQRMMQDAASAWQYLTLSRGVPAGNWSYLGMAWAASSPPSSLRDILKSRLLSSILLGRTCSTRSSPIPAWSFFPSARCFMRASLSPTP